MKIFMASDKNKLQKLFIPLVALLFFVAVISYVEGSKVLGATRRHDILILCVVLFLGGIIGFSLKSYFSTMSIEKISSRLRSATRLKLSMGPTIVAIGGGTGLSSLLRGIKAYSINITAIVTVTDEGGSSGRLRAEWGLLPPGDIRNCLVALADDEGAISSLFQYRFDKGMLSGHSLGNLILLALSEMEGDFPSAVRKLGKLLATRGRVIPVTTNQVELQAYLEDGSGVRGELAVSQAGKNIQELILNPEDAAPTQGVLQAIEEAEAIILGPGSLFTSILPNLLVNEVKEAVKKCSCPVIYISNIMTQPGETEGFDLGRHLFWIEKCLGKKPDWIVANDGIASNDVLERYKVDGSFPVILSGIPGEIKLKTDNLLYINENGQIRHDTVKLASIIMKIIRTEREKI